MRSLPSLSVPRSIRVCVWLLIVAPLAGSLQAATLPPPPIPDEGWLSSDPIANQAWAKLSAAFSASVASGARAGLGNLSGSDSAVSAALDRADQAKNFYEQYPTHPRAMEAKKHEIFALLAGGGIADPKLQARLAARVSAFRQDPALPEAERAAIAGTFDTLSSLNAPADRDLALENAARALVVEFPRQPQGYKTLLTLAKRPGLVHAPQIATFLTDAPGTPDAVRIEARSLPSQIDYSLIYSSVAKKGNPHGVQDAQALAADVTAPAAVRQRAAALVTRLGLKGRALSDLLPEIDEAKADADRKLTIVYAWSIQSPDSLALATALAKLKVERAHWIGVNLDPPGSQLQAQQWAETNHPPGRQLYADPDAKDSPSARLGLDAAPLALFVGGDGVIAYVYGAQELLRVLPYFGL